MAVPSTIDNATAMKCFDHGVALTGRSPLFLSHLGRATAILREIEERGGDN